ncbi:Lsr2 family protein [Actinomadura craniellae]|uniref:Lsr2 family protein n=1 Tax=Actinomadura craniellae TaxID=2231787 RepID=A0A365H495_9ACTN|nr:Lsr2 family protein [Actinomadura craniellae]RAY13812.1 Lsr2 family protein [Actinomadura craniellae]
MARTTVVELLDDLDGGPANETVTFALDGIDYEIDLSAQNAAALRTALGPYVAGARRARAERPVKADGGSVTRSTSDRERAAAIRSWAKQHGIEVNDRGRIPAQVIVAYEAKDPGRAKAVPDIPQVTFQPG